MHDYRFSTERALPLETYVDPKLLERERRRVFGRSWVFATTTAGLENPGDCKPARIAGQPVLLWRGGDGELRAMANVCAHRGMSLVEQPTSCDKLVCPYHAWAYDDRGRLLGAPFGPEIDRERHRLAPYDVDTWHGLVFVRMHGDGATLRQRLAPIESALDGYLPADLHPWPVYDGEDEWEANWKLVYANASESYHLFRVHPETLEPVTPTRTAYTVLRTPDAILTGGALQTGQVASEYRLLALPPSIVIVFDGTGLAWEAVDPIRATRSVVRTGAVLPGRPPTSTLGKWTAQLTSSWLGHAADFLPEDKAICERAQRAATGSFEPGELVGLEEPVAHFHESLARSLEVGSEID